MLTSLDFSINVKLNNIDIKELFEDLTNISQKTIELSPSNASTVTDIEQVFYLKTTKPLTLNLTKGVDTDTITVASSVLLTDEYDSIEIVNSGADTANCFLVIA